MNPDLRYRKLIDFSSVGGKEALASWSSIGDPVMGGVSRGEIVLGDRCAAFRGEVSRAHGGGFASVRSGPWEIDLSAWDGLALEVRGDGRSYRFNVRDDPGFDTVLHRVTFSPPAGVWTEVRAPFDRFEATRRGREVGGAPLDPGRIRGFGLMISDGRAGPFRLDVAWIGAYRESPVR